MSEFTNGLLFLRRNQDNVKVAAEKHLKPVFDYIIHDVNDTWEILLLEDFGTQLSNHRVSALIQEISQGFPLMYFDHSSDHGWSYRLISEGNVTSSVDIAYELDWYLAYDYLEVKYPDLAGDPKALFDRVDDVPALYEQLRETTAYKQAVEEMYQNHRPNQFTAFGISDEQIQRLEKEISASGYKESHELMLKQVDIFLEVLQLNEVSWMSYRYLKKRQQGDE